MPPNLQLDPTVLRATAASVAALLPALRVPGLDPSDLAVLARAPGGAAVVAEHDRLTTAAVRARRELAELVAGLGAVADGSESADHDGVRSMRAVAS